MSRQVRDVPVLLDVARKAGVGAATVSRVINGGRNVSSKTLALVTAAIKELNYVPSHAARSLKGAQTRTIGLIVPSVADPFFSAASAAIQEVANAHGYLVLLAASDNNPRKEKEYLTKLIHRRVDGLVLAPSDAASAAMFDGAGFPTVCFDRPMKGNPVTTVVADNYAGAKIATEHLIAQGYRRILCIGGYPRLFTSRRRFQGHRDVIRKAGLPYLAELKVEDYTSAEAAVLAHLSGPGAADAIFSTKNSTSVYVYKILRNLQAQIPFSMGLLGYDDFELADALDPPLSVIRQPVKQIATRAAELLIQQMETGIDTRAMLTLDVELVMRESCKGPLAGSADSVLRYEHRHPGKEDALRGTVHEL